MKLKRSHKIFVYLPSIILLLLIVFAAYNVLFFDLDDYRKFSDSEDYVNQNFFDTYNFPNVEIGIDSIEDNTFPHNFLLSYKKVVIYDNWLKVLFKEGVTFICVDQLSFEVQYNSLRKLHYSISSFTDMNTLQGECKSSYLSNGNVWTIELTNGSGHKLRFDKTDLDPLYYYYPFDEIDINPQSFIIITQKGTWGNIIGKVKIPAYLKIVSNPSIYPFPDNKVIDEEQNIILHRSMVLKIVIPILVISIILVLVVMVLLDSFTSIIELSVALILGIWALRQELVPANLDGIIALDIVFLLLYGCVLIIILFSIIKELIRKRGSVKVQNLRVNSLSKNSKM